MFDTVSILVPVFNNAETIRPLVTDVTQALDGLCDDIEFVFVEDGGSDGSAAMLRTLESAQNKVIYNVQNIGQQASIRKGLGVCRGQAVVVMDADLQDPPSAIPLMLSTLCSGAYDAVFAGRVGRYQSGWRMLNSWIFRFLIRRLTNLPLGAGGFVAMNAGVAADLAGNRQKRFYLVGLIGCGGYRLCAIPTPRNLRETGQSAYTGMMRLSLGVSNVCVVLKERMARGPRKRRTSRL